MLRATHTDLKLQSLFESADALFGERVAPLFDITGNGLPEIRVKSYVEPEFTNLIGGETLMHVFAGGDSDYADAGEFLFAIAATAEFDPWQTIPGDVTGDGSVTQADIDIILANMGKEGAHLTTFDGDLNGDGVVDALDLAIALDNLGAYLIDVVWDADGRPTVFDGGGEPLEVWGRVPGWTIPGCNVPGGLCCCPCEGSNCQCPDCDDNGGGGNPCDTNPCDENCPDRFCIPDCDPDPMGPGPAYGECHPNCPGSECNDQCPHFDACNEECGEDDEGNPYGPCHEDCEGWECNPDCEGSDPCAEECEDDGGGPCGENCEGSECNPDCEGSDPCAPECEDFGGGPCSEDCEGSECNPDCEGSDPCAEECEPFGGGPCSEDCEGSECNPDCEGSDPCAEECEDFGWGPCSPECEGSECNPDCDGFDPCAEECESEGFGPCSEECEGSECDPGCEGSNPCDPACEGFGGGPCGPACESAVCDPACEIWNPCHPACEDVGDGPCSEACEAIPFDPEQDGIRMLIVEEQAVLLDVPEPGSVTVDGLVLNAAGEIELWRGQTIEPGQVIIEAFIENNGDDVAFILVDDGTTVAVESIGPGETATVTKKNKLTASLCMRKCRRGICGHSGIIGYVDARCYCKCWACAQTDSSWLGQLPACPCSIDDNGIIVNPDPSVWQDPKAPACCHPGAVWCIRSKCPWIMKPGQQCCYNILGQLITAGAGAGTPDIAGPCGPISWAKHMDEDVQPWRMCMKVNMLDCYLHHRPPNNAQGCQCNPPGHADCDIQYGEGEDPCGSCE
jgi:hypothetical protein